MRTTTSILSALLGMAMTFALASAAQATVGRTYVKSDGLDSNTASNCARTSPCKTFSAAYSITQAGGEIIALDEAAYGPLTITGLVTISAIDGAIITVQTGTTGITISASGTDKITLRNIQISGAAGSSNTIGIALNNGRLLLQHSTLSRLTRGLQVSNSLAYVNDTEFSFNGIAVHATGAGTNPSNFAVSATTIVKISGGNVVENTTAYFMQDPGVGLTSIILRAQDSSSAATTVNHGGNATLVAGAGTGCPCSSVANYFGNLSFN